MRRLGSQYVLHAPLGRGAMGEVWRGEREADATPVAAKILRAELADDSDVVERFLRERELLLGFDHPHLVKVRDLVVEGGTLAIVMDLVDGVDLRKYLRAREVLAPREAVLLVSQVLDALAAVHRTGVVHRDIKPDNILIDTTDPEHPRAMLTDFGIARIAHGPSMTRLTGLIGTPRYMAPELSEGTRATPAADLYSIGIVVYELLAGRPPFNAEHPIAMLRAHLEQTPAPLEALPGTLWAVIARLLAKSPGDRPATAGHARAELTVALAGTDAALGEANLAEAGLDAPEATMISVPGGGPGAVIADRRPDTAPAGPHEADPAGAPGAPGDTVISPRPGMSLSPVGVRLEGQPGNAAEPAAGDHAHETLLSPLPGDLSPVSPVPARSPDPATAHATTTAHVETTAAAAAAAAGTAGTADDLLGSSPETGRPGRRARPRWLPWAAAAVATAVVLAAGSWALADAVGGGGGSGTAQELAEVRAAIRTSAPAVASSASATAPADPAAPVGSAPAATGPGTTAGPAPAAPVQAAGSPAAGSAAAGGSTASTASTGEQPAPRQGDEPTGGSAVTEQLPGDGLVAVPGVLNMVLADASSALKAAGFSNIPYLYDCYGSANTGNVVRQEPAAGARLAPTAPVHLYLQAQNCATVPDVRGMSLDDAATTLRQLGFTNIPYLYECLGAASLGTVVTQSPAPGTSQGTSAAVDLRLQANNC
ncbi:hypothetical protein BBK14_10365 [Parafrankia soli]|uniref:non-specific serine/threonine protein kinase n=1 Tax=Parafrankia soli TaxID=2599596 RepID=A0A1S1RB91_9ACTN|nr:serine/threonine-protein kinase [Parafrankia soli]OHV43039.1 hypothetical protein BBK14_10365 [Parafrankia soli]